MLNTRSISFLVFKFLFVNRFSLFVALFYDSCYQVFGMQMAGKITEMFWNKVKCKKRMFPKDDAWRVHGE